MNWNGVIFLLAFCSGVYFLRELLRSVVPVHLQADIAWLREQRRRRKAARR